ncbi:MAG: DUF2304 domain-containing protein [Nitrospirota bacterium]
MQIVQILSIVISVIILITVLELIRRNVFKERYALLWMFASVVLIIFSFWRKLLDSVASFFGFFYAPSFLFLLGFGFLLMIILHFSVVVSNMSEKNKKMAQELAILKSDLKQIKGQEENQ